MGRLNGPLCAIPEKVATVVLYTCGAKKRRARLGHPCARAAKALGQAGRSYELKTVAGYRLLPWTRKPGQRDEIERLSGQENVPILVLDDGCVVTGSRNIVSWAKAHQPARRTQKLATVVSAAHGPT